MRKDDDRPQPSFGEQVAEPALTPDQREPADPREFPHLMLYPDTQSEYRGMQDLVDTAIREYIETGEKQVIALVGPKANGKSGNIRLLAEYVQRRTQELGKPVTPSLVAYEYAFKAAQDLRALSRGAAVIQPLTAFREKKESGDRNTKDYKAATHLFGNSIRYAVTANDFVLVETPMTGGIRFEGEDGRHVFVGDDLGTTAIRKLAKGEGYDGIEYSLRVAAIIAEKKLHDINIEKRRTQTKEEADLKPGANINGTMRENAQLDRVLQSHSEMINQGPYATGDIEYPLSKTDKIAKYLFPWILHDYCELGPSQAVVLENRQGDVPDVTHEDLAPFNIYRSMPELVLWRISNELV